MKLPIIAVLLLIAFSTGVHAAESPSAQSQYCHAIVQDNKAAFVFPIIDNVEWSWFKKETKDNDLEYSWEVLLPGNKQSMKFGVFLFKFPGEKEKTGTLKQLINEAQWSVLDQKSAPNGGTTSKMLEDMKVSARIIDDGVVVGITDKATFERAFSSHPEKAQFLIRTPFDSPFSCDASIEYKVK